MVSATFERIRRHDFHPLEAERRTFTVDRELGEPGVADLGDRDGRVRSLAVRDLVHGALADPDAVARGLADEDLNVRSLSAYALGISRAHAARDGLERTIAQDPEPLARAYGAIALGEMGATPSLRLLQDRLASEPHPDVRHQLELAAAQIEAGGHSSDAQRDAFLALEENDFGRPARGQGAIDFDLDDTEGRRWRLRNARGAWVVLVWVFADWCPLCHREFAELMEMRDAFVERGVQVATLEAHDTWRARLMVGREIQPTLWGSRAWFKEAYTERIWWPHLLDRAGAVGARYGTEPLQYAVHGEFVNRPTTVIVDPAGVVRFCNAGTYWGDRPTIEQTLDMILREDFAFVHPNRLARRT